MAQKTILAMRISEVLKDKDMKDIELAEKTGISPQLISKYKNAKEGEKGKGANPTMANLVEIAKALDVSLDWLCGLSDIDISKQHNTSNISVLELATMISKLERIRGIDFEIGNFNGDQEAPIIYFRKSFFGNSWRDFATALIKVNELLRNRLIDKEIYNNIVDSLIKKVVDEYQQEYLDIETDNDPYFI